MFCEKLVVGWSILVFNCLLGWIFGGFSKLYLVCIVYLSGFLFRKLPVCCLIGSDKSCLTVILEHNFYLALFRVNLVWLNHILNVVVESICYCPNILLSFLCSFTLFYFTYLFQLFVVFNLFCWSWNMIVNSRRKKIGIPIYQ